MRNRGLFWPGVLILIGILALLINVGLVPIDRLYLLEDLWPELLIVAGLLLLVRRVPMPAATATTASVLIVVLALGGAALYIGLAPSIPGGTHTMTVSRAVGSLKAATLEVDTGASNLDVEGSPTGLVNDLFQAQITYSGPQPTVSLDANTGRVVISQNSRFGFFGRQSFRMAIQLNVAVRWTFDIHSGASTDKYVLGSVLVSSMEIDTGASREDIDLGSPSGTVPISINGGALTVSVHRPAGSAASVKVSGGAVNLNFDGRSSSAVGEVSSSTDAANDMYQLTVSGGTCTVTMDTRSGLD